MAMIIPKSGYARFLKDGAQVFITNHKVYIFTKHSFPCNHLSFFYLFLSITDVFLNDFSAFQRY